MTQTTRSVTTEIPMRRARRRRWPLVGMLWMLSVLGDPRVAAFCEEAGPLCTNHPEVCTSLATVPYCHREITAAGLPFMRPFLLERVVQSNLHMDHEHFFSAWPHFDSCDFQHAGHNINGIYLGDPDQHDVAKVDPNYFLGICLPVDIDCGVMSPFFPHFGCGIDFHCDGAHSDTWGAIGLLDPDDPRPGDAAGVFGYLLHPAQDVYSHSNWVEIFKSVGVTDPPLIEPSLDLWSTEPWQPLGVAPEFLAALGTDSVVLTDEDGYGAGWSFSGPLLSRSISTDDGHTYTAVVSDTTAGEDECVGGMSAPHPTLNKDCTKMDPDYHPGAADHFAAAKLAIRQTKHEWCRVLHLARTYWGFAGVSLPLAFWVDPHVPETGSTSAHAPGTPCAATPPGPVELSVDVDEIRVLNDTDAEGPGELNFVLVLYTEDLTRSTRTEINLADVETGAVLADAAVPGRVTLCLSEQQAVAARATVQAWDDDSGVLAQLNDGDEALRGITTQALPGISTVASPDMQVTLDVQMSPTDADSDGLFRCDEEILGTDPANADSDDDGFADGLEVAAGTNPVGNDTDGDAAQDGADNCPLVANSEQLDYESDAQGDACDLDDDNDGVEDLSDAFPLSDLQPTVVISSCDSGVANDHVFADGANFNDLIGVCAMNAKNHGKFVSCVTGLTNSWKSSGLIGNQDKTKIQNCAAQSPIGKGPGAAASIQRQYSKPGAHLKMVQKM